MDMAARARQAFGDKDIMIKKGKSRIGIFDQLYGSIANLSLEKSDGIERDDAGKRKRERKNESKRLRSFAPGNESLMGEAMKLADL